MKPKIILEGQHADSLDTDLESLAAQLTAKVPEASFSVVPKEYAGLALTFWELVLIFLPAAVKIEDAVLDVVLSETVRWLRERFKKVPRRPKYVGLFGPDGRVIKSVVLRTPDGEPEDHTQADLPHPRSLPPAIGSDRLLVIRRLIARLRAVVRRPRAR